MDLDVATAGVPDVGVHAEQPYHLHVHAGLLADLADDGAVGMLAVLDAAAGRTPAAMALAA